MTCSLRYRSKGKHARPPTLSTPTFPIDDIVRSLQHPRRCFLADSTSPLRAPCRSSVSHLSSAWTSFWIFARSQKRRSTLRLAMSKLPIFLMWTPVAFLLLSCPLVYSEMACMTKLSGGLDETSKASTLLNFPYSSFVNCPESQPTGGSLTPAMCPLGVSLFMAAFLVGKHSDCWWFPPALGRWSLLAGGRWSLLAGGRWSLLAGGCWSLLAGGRWSLLAG